MGQQLPKHLGERLSVEIQARDAAPIKKWHSHFLRRTRRRGPGGLRVAPSVFCLSSCCASKSKLKRISAATLSLNNCDMHPSHREEAGAADVVDFLILLLLLAGGPEAVARMPFLPLRWNTARGYHRYSSLQRENTRKRGCPTCRCYTWGFEFDYAQEAEALLRPGRSEEHTSELQSRRELV